MTVPKNDDKTETKKILFTFFFPYRDSKFQTDKNSGYKFNNFKKKNNNWSNGLINKKQTNKKNKLYTPVEEGKFQGDRPKFEEKMSISRPW